ncbi:MAG: hypothetical protein COB09_06765 [Thalassobium sp.]|nr:MAG: hypothetical protein COB09_06765 [Thalassobium sp.]
MYYHYTDINGLYSILLNKKLWLTDSRFLNDHTEGTEIFSYLEKAFEKLGVNGSDLKLTMKKFSDLSIGIDSYTTSFSTEADLLSQWRGYCPSSGGYCLGFKSLDRNQFEVLGDGTSLTQWLIDPQPCIYLEDKKIQLANIIANTLLEWLGGNESKDHLKYQFMMQFHNMKMLYKSSHFKEESEARVIVNVHNDQMAIPMFRTKSNLVVPYLNLIFQPRIIKEIIIGPSSKKELAKLGLQIFLKSLGPDFAHINIRHSSIPYRNI